MVERFSRCLEEITVSELLHRMESTLYLGGLVCRLF